MLAADDGSGAFQRQLLWCPSLRKGSLTGILIKVAYNVDQLLIEVNFVKSKWFA